MKKKEFRLHEESGLWVARDGEVLVPRSGVHSEHYTYGYKDNHGYMIVWYQGKPYKVHRLVAEVFIPNPEGKKEVDHINTNRSDNRVENLRWSTRGENCNNAMSRQHYSEAKKGRSLSEETKQKLSELNKGKKQSEETIKKRVEKNKKPVVGTNKETGEVVEFESATDAWLTLNISAAHICSCCRGRYKSAGGWKWEYLT